MLTRSGSKEAPITIRAYPGELAIVDGGLREFAETPEAAWEPFADGAEGEFVSTRTYAALDNRRVPDEHPQLYAFDSMSEPGESVTGYRWVGKSATATIHEGVASRRCASAVAVTAELINDSDPGTRGILTSSRLPLHRWTSGRSVSARGAWSDSDG